MYKRIFQLLFGLLISAATVSTAMAVQVSNIVIEFDAARSMRFSWTPGTGEGSIATMRLQATPESAPVDGTDYVAQTDYSLAPQTAAGSGNFVVYKGVGNSVIVNGLVQNVTYTIAVYTFSGSGVQTDYVQLDPAQLSQATNGPAMHNYDNAADCGTCHSNHGNSGLVPRGANQEDVCKTCHNPLGVAAAMSDIAIHGTPNHGVDDVDCGSCHELHRIKPGSSNTTLSTNPVSLVTDYNLAFVRANVDKYIPTATADDAINQVKGNDQAIEGGDATTSRGICQACHTATDYHRNNSAVAVSQCHKGGTGDSCDGSQVICTDCHTHLSGFEPSGSCISCHSSTQGGAPPNDRRAVVTEFSLASTHVEFTSLVDEDCTVCHQQSSITPSHNHQDGFLTLWDTDNHSNSGFQLNDHSDPLTTSSEAAKLNNFCLTCHDSNGAQAELNPAAPFSGSIAPVDIATNWPPSSHATSPVSCLGDGAFGCHGGGHGGEKLNLLAPASPAATPTNFSEEEEGFCYNCHDGSPASTNIQSEFAKTYHHPVVNSQQSGGRKVECTSCHNPHQATASLGAPGPRTTPRPATGPLEGVDGINTSGTAVSPAAYEYEVCYKCHETGTAPTQRQYPQTNVRLEFNGTKSSYHPVTTNNASASSQPSLINGWANNSIMACSDCHNNNSGPATGGAGPNGPHGSSFPRLLERRYDTADNTSYNVANYASCFKCHSSSSILSESSLFGDHNKHISEKQTPCNICHDPHASDNPRLINFDTSAVTGLNGTGSPVFNWTSPGNGSCTLRCHGTNHNNWSY
jgi:predicted CXXCH cytochrome family protein